MRWLLLLLLMGCDYVLHFDEVHAGDDARADSNATDATEATDAAVMTCGPFAGPPADFQELDGLVGADPAISRDELELYVTHPGIALDEIAVSHRATIGSRWSAPVSLAGINTGASNDQDPSITGDGMHLVFISDRVGGTDGGFEITRISGDSWSPPSQLAGLESTVMHSIAISWDGLTVYYTDSSGALDTATRPTVTSAFTAPLTALDPPVLRPTISADQRELYFNGVDVGIDRATRSSLGEEFSMRATVTSVDTAPALSYDGRTLYVYDAVMASVATMQRSCQ